MLNIRVIPSLLIRNGGLVKTVKFADARYVGDPINAIKIFNEKEVDELAVIDIDASRQHRPPDYEMLLRINKEAFMPLAYGGGIKTLEEIQKILNIGYEKVIINSKALDDPPFVTEAAKECGNQSVVVCIDVKKNLLGQHRVYDHIRRKVRDIKVRDYAQQMEKNGAGEILLYSVDRDGTFSGYDLHILKEVTSAVSVPVIALGGAGKIEDFADAVKKGGASAVSAGSLFVFHGPHRAVLITYPERKEMERLLNA